MGFALKNGISYHELDNMNLDEFELAKDCISAYLEYVNGNTEKTKKKDLRSIPTDESSFDFFA